MGYSIKKELGKPNSNKESKIYLLIIVDRKKIRIDSNLKTSETNQALIDIQFNKKRHEIEGRIIELISRGIEITKDNVELTNPIGSEILFTDYIEKVSEVIKGKYSEKRATHYLIVRDKVELWNPNLKLSEVNSRILDGFEKYLRLEEKLWDNTIAAKMAIIKAVINYAIGERLLPMDAILGYKNPRKVAKIPLYLSVDELKEFEEYVLLLANTTRKKVGMYFLLSCYTGYRISDLYAFNYDNNIKDGRITIRATKNKEIVSMPIHNKLNAILDYIKDNPIELSEQKFRTNLKSIALDKGLNDKIHPHSGRHTFAMYLLSKGFTVDRVADYLGDTTDVTKVYARIVQTKSNDDQILDAFS